MAAVGIFVFLVGVCFGQDSSDFHVTPHGHASMQVGDIVAGHDKNVGDISNVWFGDVFLGGGFDARFGNSMFMGDAEVEAFNEFPRIANLGATRRYYYYFYLWQAELTHRLIDNSGLLLDVGGGYFPYKYDGLARNLGEYLFRSTTYPQTLTTEFDYPYATLAGLYAKSSYTLVINKFGLDVIANLNSDWYAICDVNLSFLASWNLARIFEIGAGVSFCNILSADESQTTPKNVNTAYLSGNDTLYYTFRGTKLMARASIDPKRFFPKSSLLGDADLELYGEAALLGVQNYPRALNSPIWYGSILERIPVMMGFNLPAFKFLDTLSVEGEWWGNRYPNSLEGVVNDEVPLPFISGTSTIDSTLYKNDDWKWSVYACKTFARHYRIAFQVASDHMRTFAWDWDRQDWEEALRGPNKWYYVLKFGVMF